MATAIGSGTEVNVVSFTQLRQESTGPASRTTDKDNYDKSTDGEMNRIKDSAGSKQDVGWTEVSAKSDTDIIIRRQDAEAELYQLAREMEAQKQQGKGDGNSSGGLQGEDAVGSDSTSNTTGIFNKKDANQDGVVTFQEELVYSMNHPLE